MKRGKPAFIALLLSVVLTAGLISPGYSTEVYAEESASTQTEKSENTGISDDDQSEETGDSDEQDSAENFDDSSAENGQKISDNAGTGTAVDTNDTDSQSSDQTDNASANQTDDAATEGSTNKPGDAATEDSANKPDDAATADSANKSDDAATADSTNKSGDVATADSPDKSDDAATEDSAAKPVVPIIRRIISPITTPRRTYYFYDGDQLADQQTVKNGDTLLAPDCPDDQKAKRFLGWYEKDGGDFAEDSFDGFGEVTGIEGTDETVNLYAKYKDTVYLYYHDEDGDIIESQEVTPDTEVTIYNDSPSFKTKSVTTALVGWSLSPNSTDDVAGKFSVGNDSVNLYPIVKEGYWVTFNSDAQTSYYRQFVPLDAPDDQKKAVKPQNDPLKQGYTFEGWYADQELTHPYDFDSIVNGNITLYAKYVEAPDTQYTVKYWIEYQVEDKSNAGKGTWDYKLFGSELKSGTTGGKTSYTPDFIFEKNAVSETQYKLNFDKTDAEKVIAADGTTVANVYYDCKAYSISLIFPGTDGNTHTVSDTNVKYSASLNYLWDEVYRNVDKETLLNSNHVWRNTNNSNEAVNDSDLSVMSDSNRSWTYDKITGLHYERFYFEALDGEDYSTFGGVVKNHSARVRLGGINDNRNYYLYQTVINPFFTWALEDFPTDSEPFTGFSLALSRFVGDGNLAKAKINNKIEIGIWLHSHPDRMYGMTNEWGKNPYEIDDKDIDPDGYLDIYFWRNRYSLTFVENGGPELSDYIAGSNGDPMKGPEQLSSYDGSKGIPYDMKLQSYEPSSYVIGETTKTASDGREYVFTGWYTNAECTNQFSFNSRMPDHNLILYAGWKPRTLTVTFHYGNGDPDITVKDIAYGNAIEQPADPSWEGRNFVGWTLNGRPFNFLSGISSDITLTAQWRSVHTFGVTYDLNGGTGNVPKDDGQYYENAGVTAASGNGITPPSGKVFLGWKVKNASGEDADKIYYPKSSVPMLYGGMVLQAVYGDAEKTTQITYNFNYNHFGIETAGDGSRTVTQIRNNETITLADITSLTEVPDEWTFNGWFIDPDCTKKADEAYVVDTEDQERSNIVYAGWIRKTDDNIKPDDDQQPSDGQPSDEQPDEQPGQHHHSHHSGGSQSQESTAGTSSVSSTIPAISQATSAVAGASVNIDASVPAASGSEGQSSAEALAVNRGTASQEKAFVHTGDDSQIILYLLVMCAAGGALLAAAAYRRRRTD